MNIIIARSGNYLIKNRSGITVGVVKPMSKKVLFRDFKYTENQLKNMVVCYD